MVARGLSKGSTEEKLTDHLKDVGIEPLSIELMTKPDVIDNVNSLTFKVTLKAADLENSLKSEMWPYRVSVRFFKNFRPKRQNDNRSDIELRNRYSTLERNAIA